MAENDNRPKDTAFRQQRLKAFKPVHSAKSSAIILFLASLFFFTFGILLYVENNNQTEYYIQYGDRCQGVKSCEVWVKIPATMKQPIFFYYELENFYQNYRLYVKSKSYTQLRGDSPSSTELSYCNKARYNRDFVGYYTGKTLDSSETARPCGLIARSVFNDTFSITGHSLEVEDIVTSTDRDMYQQKDLEKEWTDMDEHFIVWMKIAPMPTFRKLFGIVRKDIQSGTLRVAIQNNYDMGGWDGKKHFVLSTAGKFGGRNFILGIVFLVSGTFCFLCSLVFASAMMFCKQKWMEQDPRTWKF